MKKLQNFFLLLILILATVLRLWKLDQYPAGLNADEAAIGYNAYSILRTGRDEHGEALPIHFKSFGDYKPGLYFYLVLPFVKFLGLNVWAVRLPSVILGVLSVLFVYLLIKELFSSIPALLAGLLLAISPWHIHFSRGGWETNVATFFILVGVYFFFKALKNPKFFVFSFSFLVFSMYTYHGARVLAPLLGGALLVLKRKEIFVQKSKMIFFSMMVAILFLLPLFYTFIFTPAGAARFSGLSLFADEGPFWRINQLRGEHGRAVASPLVRLLHNRPLVYGLEFAQNFLDHFDGVFLFILGDSIKRSNVPEMGELYLFDLPFLAFGVYFLIKNKEKNWLFPFIWLGIAPLAASLTFQTPSALRAHGMVIPLALISGYGFYFSLRWLKENYRFLFPIVSFLILIFISWNCVYYLRQYYLHYPKRYPEAWEYGFEELVEYLKPIEKNYQKIYVTDEYDQPYILFAFYLPYSPEKLQGEIKLTPRDKFGFSTVRHFGKYWFGLEENPDWKNEKDILVCGTDEEIPDDADIIKTIYFKNGQPAFQIAQR